MYKIPKKIWDVTSTYTCNSESIAAESKTLHTKVKEGFGEGKHNGDMKISGMVPIGGAIIHPR